MFDQYSESARRAIFFARYEASNFGSREIDTHHLLLGALREDRTTPGPLLAEIIRRRLEIELPRGAYVETTVDLPLSLDGQRALAFAAEEAEMLQHKWIDTEHLLLGLLRVENSLAAIMLRENRITLERLRGLAGKITRPAQPVEFMRIAPEAASLKVAIDRLFGLVIGLENALCIISEPDALRVLAPKAWSRKEALGHLLDWATTHHQWFACALTEPKLVAAGYPADEWAWDHLVRLWVSMNLLLIHVLSGVPEVKLNTPCRIGINPLMPLSELIARYVDHCEDILAQILTRG